MKILYCADFEGASEYSLEKVRPFLREGCVIDIISVIETGVWPVFQEYPEKLKENRKQRLEDIKSQLEGKGFKVGETYCPLGNAGDGILQRIYSDDYSLVVTGSRRRAVLGVRLGSTSRKIVEKSPVPIFVACRTGGITLQSPAPKVLFAVDDTEHSYNSIRTAASIFNFENTANEILYVKSDIEVLPPEIQVDREWMAKIALIAQEHAEEVIAKTTELAEENGIKIGSKVVLEGFPVDEILKYLNKNPKDLIIMGSHGREGLSSLLLGSVSRAILDNVCHPIVIIPVKRQKRIA
jgi:nucleotide-binding universal stress UspA family protein